MTCSLEWKMHPCYELRHLGYIWISIHLLLWLCSVGCGGSEGGGQPAGPTSRPRHHMTERAYNASHLLDTLLLGYDKRLRPGFGGKPIRVDVNLNIRSMGPVSEKEMSYQMDCYFRQSWVDPRLVYNSHGSPTTLQVAINVLDRLWKPDTHFFNGKRSYLHTVTSPNKLLRIRHDGTILYSMRLTIQASCPMHLEKFPMDTQTCPLKFGSHGYGIRDVVYVWTNGSQNSIKMASDMTLSQFDLIGYPHSNETRSQHLRDPYTVLWVNFSLRRHMGYFLINVYVPCSLMVVISWVSFWINREATADRIALGITTVLTMTFLSIETRVDLPEISYSTALDCFVGTCFAFVLATIMQFSGVHFFTKVGSGEVQPEQFSESEDDLDEDSATGTSMHSGRFFSNVGRKRMLVTGKANGETNVTLQYDTNTANNKYPPKPKHSCCYKFWNCIKGSASYREMQYRAAKSRGGVNSVSRVDKASRIIFPLCFALFNICYWSTYLYQGGDMLM